MRRATSGVSTLVWGSLALLAGYRGHHSLALSLLLIYGLYLLAYRRQQDRLTSVLDLPKVGKPLKQPKLKGTALICGGSHGGIFAARALAEHFEKVLIIDDEEQVEGQPVRRTHVKQVKSLHDFGPLVYEWFRTAYATFDEELKAVGGILTNYHDVWTGSNRCAVPQELGAVRITMTRIGMETLHRRLLLRSHSNVEILHGRVVDVAMSEPSNERIDQVHVSLPSGEKRIIDCAFVVDASGPASVGIKWLRRLGYETPTRSLYDPQIPYSDLIVYPSRDLAQKLPQHPSGRDVGFVGLIGAEPGSDAPAVVLAKREDGSYCLNCSLWDANFVPPQSPAEALACAKQADLGTHMLSMLESLVSCENYEVVKGTVNYCSRLGYDALERLPHNFVAFGDSVQQLNPCYGDGHTQLAISAITLNACLRTERSHSSSTVADGFSKRYFRKTLARTDVLWNAGLSLDRQFDSWTAKEGLEEPEEQGWEARLLSAVDFAAQRDACCVAVITSMISAYGIPLDSLNIEVLARVAWQYLLYWRQPAKAMMHILEILVAQVGSPLATIINHRRAAISTCTSQTLPAECKCDIVISPKSWLLSCLVALCSNQTCSQQHQPLAPSSGLTLLAAGKGHHVTALTLALIYGIYLFAYHMARDTLTSLMDLPNVGKASGPKLKGTAVICGGSQGGLFAARTLSDYYEKVIIVDDEAQEEGKPVKRAHVWQMQRNHAFAPLVFELFKRWYPSFADEAKAAGMPLTNYANVRMSMANMVVPIPRSLGVTRISATRVGFETLHRKLFFATCPNVEVMHGRVVDVEESIAGSGRIDKVHVSLAAGGKREMEAALVVDCSGPSNVGLKWLKKLGYKKPGLRLFDPQLRYVDMILRPSKELEAKLPAQASGDELGMLGWIYPPAGSDVPAIVLIKREEGFCISCAKWDPDFEPPRTPVDAFVLAQQANIGPCIYSLLEVLQHCEDFEVLQGSIKHCSRLHYDRLKRLPHNFIAFGDSVAQLSPIYGAGHTQLAAFAVALDRVLRTERAKGRSTVADGFSKGYFAKAMARTDTVAKGGVWLDEQWDSFTPKQDIAKPAKQRSELSLLFYIAFAAQYDERCASVLIVTIVSYATPLDLFNVEILARSAWQHFWRKGKQAQ